MSEKEKLPFWLGVVLGLILGMSVVLVVVVPQLDRTASEPHAAGLKQDEVNQHEMKRIVSNQAASNQATSNQMTSNQISSNHILSNQTALKQSELLETTAEKASLARPKDQHDDVLGDSKSAIDMAIQKTEKHSNSVTALEQDSDPSTASAGMSELHGIQSNSAIVQEKKHGIALVIDDVGYDLRAVERVLALSVPIALSILPESPFAQQSAVLAKQAGQVVMLHLPMQPEDPSLQMTQDFLLANMEKQAIRETFLRDLGKVPFVEGVNNHMGSKLTKLLVPMQWVMQMCQEKKLFFVDSRTSAQSVAATAAKSMGLSWASRSIFLDHEMTLEAMKHAWQRARNCAKKKLSCVVIAHPRAKTVTFLENYLSKEDAKHMVSIRHLLQTTPLITQASQITLP